MKNIDEICEELFPKSEFNYEELGNDIVKITPKDESYRHLEDRDIIKKKGIDKNE